MTSLCLTWRHFVQGHRRPRHTHVESFTDWGNSQDQSFSSGWLMHPGYWVVGQSILEHLWLSQALKTMYECMSVKERATYCWGMTCNQRSSRITEHLTGKIPSDPPKRPCPLPGTHHRPLSALLSGRLPQNWCANIAHTHYIYPEMSDLLAQLRIKLLLLCYRGSVCVWVWMCSWCIWLISVWFYLHMHAHECVLNANTQCMAACTSTLNKMCV